MNYNEEGVLSAIYEELASINKKLQIIIEALEKDNEDK